MALRLNGMFVRTTSVAALLAALSALPLTATAAPAKVDASGLAVVDAVVHFCSGADPGDTPRYRQLVGSLVGNLSDRQRDVMETTPDYRQVYSLINSVLTGAPKDWAVSSCKNVIASTHGGDSDSDHDDRNKGHEDQH